MSMAKRHVQNAAVARHGVGASLEVLERLVEMRDGLVVRVHARRFVGHAHQIRHSLLGQIRTRVVIRERALDFVDPIGMEGLERFCRPHVQRLPPRPEQTVVGDILGERMLEHVRRIAGFVPLVEKLEAAQLQQVVLESARTFPQAHQQPVRHFATDDGGCLQQPLGRLG